MRICIVNAFDTYQARVDMIHRSFVKNNHSVQIVQSDFSHRFKNKRKLTKEIIMIKVPTYRKNFSFKRILSHIIFNLSVDKHIKKNRYDLVYFLVPPYGVKSKKRRKTNHLIIYDVIDMWPESFPLNIPNLLYKMLIKNRTRKINDASIVLCECNLFKDKLKQDGVFKDIHTLYFAKIMNTMKIERPKLDRQLNLCYIGTVNKLIDLDIISTIIYNLSTKYDVSVHIIGGGERLEEFVDVINNSGGNSYSHGLIFDEESKLSIINTCHLGINIMIEKAFVGLTMKSIDYFSFGLPIINNIAGDTSRFVEEYKCGYSLVELQNMNYILNNEDLIYRSKNSKYIYDRFFTEAAFRDKLLSII